MQSTLSVCSRRPLVRNVATASSSQVVLPQADRRSVLAGWAAAVFHPQLQKVSLDSAWSTTHPSPQLSLAYLDPSICVSATYPKQFYLQKLQSSSQLAKQQLGELLEREAYDVLSNSLVLDSFNDMRQAAFYLPCALAHESVETANQAQSDYLQFLKECRNLDTTARAAASARADHNEVEEAVSSVWKAAEKMMRLC